MNILHMISKNDRYGAQRIFLDQIAALHARGHRVMVVVCGTDGYVTDSVRGMGLPCHGISMKRLQDFLFLHRLITDQKIDIIHTTLDRADYLGLILSWITHLPVVSTMMGTRCLPGYRFMDRIFTLANKQAPLLRKGGVRQGSVSLIRPGIDVQRLSHPDQDKKKTWRYQLSVDSFSLVFCHISSVLPRKAHMVSLELISECKRRGERPLLVILGDPLEGDYFASLLKRSSELGISRNIHFTGWTPDIPEILSLSHFTVLPSENEALGIVLMEGMAAGTPIIAREGEGGAELINEFGTGFLYNPKEGVSQLADRILALKQNQTGYMEMSEKCRKTAEEHFSLSRFGQKLECIYTEILKQKQGD